MGRSEEVNNITQSGGTEGAKVTSPPSTRPTIEAYALNASAVW